MEGALTIDTGRFMNAMDQVRTETGMELGTIMRDQMALLSRSLVRITPPLDVDDETGQMGSDAAALRKGKKAVEADIRAIVQGVKGNAATAFGEKWVARHEGRVVGHLFKASGGGIYAAEDEYVDPTGQRIGAFHESKRNSKTGRVSTSARRDAKTAYTVGNWKAHRRLHVPEATLREYIAKVQERVGKTRAGWVRAVNHFMSHAITVKWTPPDWVARHGFTSPGGYEDSYDGRAVKGTFAARNSVPWIGSTRAAQLMAGALRVRALDLERGHYVKRLQRIMDKHEGKAS